MKTLCALVAMAWLSASTQAHTRWPAAWESGFKQGLATGSMCADRGDYRPNEKERAAAAEEAATAVSCPDRMRARWVEVYAVGFILGYDHAIAEKADKADDGKTDDDEPEP